MNLQKLIEELKRDEGVKFKPYHCSADKLTIGVGRNLEDVGISEAESDFLLANDIRKRVMINMCFNLGLSRLLNFKKFLAAMEAADWEEAAVQMLDSKWARQVGPRATRLKDMMVEG
jgi:lysozyme